MCSLHRIVFTAYIQSNKANSRIRRRKSTKYIHTHSTAQQRSYKRKQTEHCEPNRAQPLDIIPTWNNNKKIRSFWLRCHTHKIVPKLVSYETLCLNGLCREKKQRITKYNKINKPINLQSYDNSRSICKLRFCCHNRDEVVVFIILQKLWSCVWMRGQNKNINTN